MSDKIFFRNGVCIAILMLIIGTTARLSQGHATESSGLLIVGGFILFSISSLGYIVNYNNKN
jgi:hypothetical protein